MKTPEQRQKEWDEKFAAWPEWKKEQWHLKQKTKQTTLLKGGLLKRLNPSTKEFELQPSRHQRRIHAALKRRAK